MSPARWFHVSKWFDETTRGPALYVRTRTHRRAIKVFVKACRRRVDMSTVEPWSREGWLLGHGRHDSNPFAGLTVTALTGRVR